MKKIVITPPPTQIENKSLAIWINNAHSTIKALLYRVEILEKKLNKDK